MPKQIIIAEQHRIAAVFSEDQIQELIVATGEYQVGDIYVGTVENILPGIDAAFVNIGDGGRNGFIHVSDLGPLRLKRAAGSITELLAPQQKVLVQVMKEPTGNKGPRLTGNITLPGRYLVLMPFGRGVNLSRRIRNDQERNRLRALAILTKPAGMGLLVRTEAEGVPEEAIMEDLELLQKRWENIQQEAVSTRPPNLLNRDDDFIQRVLRDMYSSDVNRIVTDSHTGLKRVKQNLANWNGGKSPQGVFIDHHREQTPILEFFRVNAAIREALKPRVDLPSGGYIIIEPTEALTVIDVNSGSFTRSATARETVLWTNSEAAAEIARQLRLRNVAGVIVVDFIDMDSRRDKLQVLESFNKALRADKAKPQIAQLSELGLVELTRKRQGQNIYELFGQGCPTCGGLGHLAHLPGEPNPLDNLSVETTKESSLDARVPGARRSSAIEEQSAGVGLDASPDLQELDLVNHPSYQERSGLRRNRRRRRTSESSNRSLNTRSAEPETEVKPAETPERTEAETQSNSTGNKSGRSERSDRSERSRSRGGRDKPPTEPPTVVTVEMTEDEQEIYALMGISPLLLSNQEVKEPKSAMISVVLPGQSSATFSSNAKAPSAPSPQNRSGGKEAASSNRAEERSADDQSPAVQKRNTKSKPSSASPVLVSAASKAEENGTSGSATATVPESDAAEGNGSTVVRRRRRRSSANN